MSKLHVLGPMDKERAKLIIHDTVEDIHYRNLGQGVHIETIGLADWIVTLHHPLRANDLLHNAEFSFQEMHDISAYLEAKIAHVENYAHFTSHQEAETHAARCLSHSELAQHLMVDMPIPGSFPVDTNLVEFVNPGSGSPVHKIKRRYRWLHVGSDVGQTPDDIALHSCGGHFRFFHPIILEDVRVVLGDLDHHQQVNIVAQLLKALQRRYLAQMMCTRVPKLCTDNIARSRSITCLWNVFKEFLDRAAEHDVVEHVENRMTSLGTGFPSHRCPNPCDKDFFMLPEDSEGGFVLEHLHDRAAFTPSVGSHVTSRISSPVVSRCPSRSNTQRSMRNPTLSIRSERPSMLEPFPEYTEVPLLLQVRDHELLFVEEPHQQGQTDSHHTDLPARQDRSGLFDFNEMNNAEMVGCEANEGHRHESQQESSPASVPDPDPMIDADWRNIHPEKPSDGEFFTDKDLPPPQDYRISSGMMKETADLKQVNTRKSNPLKNGNKRGIPSINSMSSIKKLFRKGRNKMQKKSALPEIPADGGTSTELPHEASATEGQSMLHSDILYHELWADSSRGRRFPATDSSPRETLLARTSLQYDRDVYRRENLHPVAKRNRLVFDPDSTLIEPAVTVANLEYGKQDAKVAEMNPLELPVNQDQIFSSLANASSPPTIFPPTRSPPPVPLLRARSSSSYTMVEASWSGDERQRLKMFRTGTRTIPRLSADPRMVDMDDVPLDPQFGFSNRQPTGLYFNPLRQHPVDQEKEWR